MVKAAKIPAANGDTSSPKKGAGGLTQKYKPSPQKTSPKKEGKKPKIVNLKHPDGTCYNKLAKHGIYRTLNIPALHLYFIDHFAHPCFSCLNTPLLLLFKSLSALTLSKLFYRNTSPV